MTLGSKAITSFSRKQKINGKSLTEAELIGLDLWMRYFMEGQDYKSEENILFQDNKSAMLLEKNGRMSSLKELNISR